MALSPQLQPLGALLRSYSQVLFSDHLGVGLLLLLATFVVPSVGVHGATAVLAAAAVSAALRFPREAVDAGLFGYNALLLGLGIGAYFAVGPISLGLAAAGGVATAVGTAAWRSSTTLPVLTAPFLACMWGIVSLGHAQGWLQASAAPAAEGGVQRVLEAVGALFFVPYVAAGLGVVAGLIVWSRQGLVLATAGAALGAVLAGGLGLPAEVVGVNLALVAVALGGVWFVPSWSSLGLGLGAGALGSLVAAALWPWFQAWGLPLLIAPFNVTVWAFLLAMRQRSLDGHPKAVDFVPGTPETNLETARTRLSRFGARYWVRFRLPVLGRWVVTQGEGDGPTHLGAWKSAIDLEVGGHDGSLHRGEGTRRKEYHCYGLPVLACADGTVAGVVDGVPDNEVGEVDLEDNWGNVVVLWHAPGLYSLVAHLMPGSLEVVEGQRVRRGDPLGKCGSSGRSPRPHLHFQLQGTAQVGAPTLPLEVHDVVHVTEAGPRLRAAWAPAVGDTVVNLVPSTSWRRDLGFEPSQRMVFDHDGREVEVVSELDLYGRRLWRDPRGGLLVYGLDDDLLTVYQVQAAADSVLHLIAAALPRVPLDDDLAELEWVDHLAPRQHMPLGLRWLWDAVAPFVPWQGLEVAYRVDRDGTDRLVVGSSRDGRVDTLARVRSGVGLVQLERTVAERRSVATRILEER